MKTKTKTFIWCIVPTIAVGALGALLTMGNMDIYNDIVKPPLSPPGFLFPIVWTILYALMGASLAIIINTGRKTGMYVLPAIRIYIAQLIVNFFWSIIFFNLRTFLFSFAWLLLLWFLIIDMIFKFYKISRLASLINLPYFLWVTFAAYLNLMIYILN